ncbi:MAG: NAD(P)/FAD-dependent oxidoreductase [Nitrososphaerota archaeon]
MRSVDAVVIGGGVAGLISAMKLAENGLEVIVAEEHGDIGVPEHCAGLYSRRGLEMLKLNSVEKCIENNRVKGAYFYSPSGKMLKIESPRSVAVVCSRTSLDKLLAKIVKENGGELLLCERIIELKKNRQDNYIVKTKSGLELSSKIVIDAEGMQSLILHRFLGKKTERRMWVPIIQLWVEKHDLDPRYVHIFFEEYAQEFFGYAIPIDEEYAKIGLASRMDLKKKIEKFLKERFPCVGVFKQVSHTVYTGRPLYIDLDSRAVPVGDAAGHVKASTGGGVIMGGLIAQNVAEALSKKLLEKEDWIRNKHTIRKLIRELEKIAYTTKVIRSVPVKLYDKIFNLLDDEYVLEEISREADMDLQFTSISRILSKPKIILNILRKLFLTILF